MRGEGPNVWRREGPGTLWVHVLGAGVVACGAECWTVPKSAFPILCNLDHGHAGEHCSVYDETAWRSWPVHQTEPLPLQ